MPLHRLVELHDRIADWIEPEHHRRRPVDWLLDLDLHGRFLGLVATTDEKGRGLERTVPYRRRSGQRPPPYLLCDTAAYVLGWAGEKWTDEVAVERHGWFKELVDDCAATTELPEVRAVARFLADGAEVEVPDPPPGDDDLIAFRVGDRIVTDLPAVQAFWQARLSPAESDEAAWEGECVICGRWGPVAKRHPVELKLGAARVQIVTANESAFESWGLEASEVAPVCLPCALQYGRAANYLMTSPDHHYAIEGLHWIYWTRSGGSGGAMAILADPQPEDVGRLLESVHSGSRARLDPESFYAASLTVNTSRLVIRDWLEATVGEAEAHLGRWFDLQALVGRHGEPSHPIGLYGLAGSLVRKLKDLPPQVLPALLTCALRGQPLPTRLLHLAIRRAHADSEDAVTRPRAMLVKMVLNSNCERNCPMVTEALDLSNRDPAYLCGRLLAVLEDAQRAALGNVNATIVDRFFATASSAPASVFGRLLRGVQNHMHTLRRDKPGVHKLLQERLEDVTAHLQEFPRALDLTQQGLFMLGYYHQRAEGRRQIAERLAARKAAGQPDDEDELVTALTEEEDN